MLLLRRIGRLFTSAGDPVEDAAVLVGDDGRIAFAGREADLRPELAPHAALDEVDVAGALVTPGLVDAHTHPVYAGDRFPEIALRSGGASYLEIAEAGGGIAATVRATRAATGPVLAEAVRHRLAAFLRAGTTTLEAKTGYHLDEEGERAAVALLAGLNGEPELPAVEVTYLAGHGVGPEFAGDADGYATAVAAWTPGAAAAGARHADVFCDEGYFTTAQAATMLAAAARAGLSCRLHADELACTGGAELAAELGCASADHLLRVDAAGIAALARAGVVATLAPVTALAMGTRPPVEALREAGVVIALGSDHNPGTCGVTSMSLVVALAVAELGLSVHDALVAATDGGARSLRLPDRGTLVAGAAGDLVAWEADHEGAFAWSYGLAPRLVVRSGRVVGP